MSKAARLELEQHLAEPEELDAEEGRAWWDGICFSDDRQLTQSMVSDAIWYQLLNLARRRHLFCRKFVGRNSDPLKFDRIILGELNGILRLSSALSSAGVITVTGDNYRALEAVIKRHMDEARERHKTFP